MSTVILSGTTLLEYVQQARNVCGPDFPIIGLNRQYHIEPHRTLKNIQLTTSHRGRPLDGKATSAQGVISTHYLTLR